MEVKRNIDTISLITAQNGMMTAQIQLTNGNSFLLHNPHDPVKEAKEWLTHIELASRTAYIVFGFGLGYHVKALLEVISADSQIFVVEHCREESLAILVKQRFSDIAWMDDGRLSFIAGPDIRQIAAQINKRLQSVGIRRLVVGKHLPTMNIDIGFYSALDSVLIRKVQELISLDYTFRNSASRVMMKNAWDNFPRICSSPGITGLMNIFKDYPAIIVSGGPSLDKNIQTVKEFQDKAIIICAGSALGALYRNDIVPHFLTVIDPFPGMEKVFTGCLNSQTSLVSPYVITNELIANYPGKLFFYHMPKLHENSNVLNKLSYWLPDTDTLLVNVSVAVTAVSLACYMGANPIILVGQDMSFAEGSTHAQGVQTGSYGVEGSYRIKGQHGEDLLTNPGLKELLDYFTSWFNTMQDRTVINATEGGAYIDGISHMTFKQAAEQYLVTAQDSFSIIDEVHRQVSFMGSEEYTDVLSEVNRGLNFCHKYLQSLYVHITELQQSVGKNEDAEIGQHIKNIEEDFSQLKKSPEYGYFSLYMDLYFELAAFQEKDKLGVIEQCNLYAHLYEQFRSIYSEVKQSILTTIERLTKN